MLVFKSTYDKLKKEYSALKRDFIGMNHKSIQIEEDNICQRKIIGELNKKIRVYERKGETMKFNELLKAIAKEQGKDKKGKELNIAQLGSALKSAKAAGVQNYAVARAAVKYLLG